jgi:hypothetical protein
LAETGASQPQLPNINAESTIDKVGKVHRIEGRSFIQFEWAQRHRFAAGRTGATLTHASGVTGRAGAMMP